jgi:hypothetical protein
METAAAAMAVTVIPVETRTPEDLDPIFPAGERTGGRPHRRCFSLGGEHYCGGIGDAIAYDRRISRTRRFLCE